MFSLKKIYSNQSPVKTSYPDVAKNLSSDRLEVENWVISEFIVNNLIPVVAFHPFPLTELQLMTAAVTYFKPKMIFEWGTHVGKSARVFYEITKAFNIDSEIHSIDLPDEIDHVEHPGETRGVMVRGLERVTLHQADGVTKSIELAEAKKVKDSEILFFVDGDHSYESVTRELNAIYKRFPGCSVLLHDTLFQSSDSNYNVGPHKAVAEFLEAHKEYKHLAMETGLPGMTLIYR